MKLLSTELVRGRFLKQVAVYQPRRRKPFSVHMTAPGWVPDPVSSDQFFLLGAAIAFVLAEDYSQDIPVSETVFENFAKLQTIWTGWYPNKRMIETAAPLAPQDGPASTGTTDEACFFTAGVDSLFTVHQLQDAITALLHVVHVGDDEADIAAAFETLTAYQSFADLTGRKFIPVASNLMSAVPEFMDAWAYLSHGIAYAAAAHSLSGQLHKIHISSSMPAFAQMPWGSHPDTDRLFGSDTLEVNHYGTEWERWDKTLTLADDKRSLSIMNVCAHGHQEGAFSNCSTCQKCARTMLMLDLAGVNRADAPSFDWSVYDMSRISRLHLRSRNEVDSMHDVRNRAVRLGRDDIASAVETMLRRSNRYLFLTEWEYFVRKRLGVAARLKRPLKAMREGVYRLFRLRRTL